MGAWATPAPTVRTITCRDHRSTGRQPPIRSTRSTADDSHRVAGRSRATTPTRSACPGLCFRCSRRESAFWDTAAKSSAYHSFMAARSTTSTEITSVSNGRSHHRGSTSVRGAFSVALRYPAVVAATANRLMDGTVDHTPRPSHRLGCSRKQSAVRNTTACASSSSSFVGASRSASPKESHASASCGCG